MSGRLLYNNQASKPLAGVPVQLKNLTGATLVSDTTDSIGFYALVGVPNGTYRLDAVLNGGTGGGANATDALLASRHFGQLTFLSPWALVAADVDGNGQVNNTDALLIARRG
ncbi:MAG: dockerin type I domain-containing protein, partial [Bacteroidota bacterium]